MISYRSDEARPSNDSWRTHTVLFLLAVTLATGVVLSGNTSPAAAGGMGEKPAATPVPPLSKAGLDAFMAELKESLEEQIENSEQTEAVIAKWNARTNLAGRTRTAVIFSLFLDLRSVITDKAATDRVWESWSQIERRFVDPDPVQQAPKAQPSVETPTDPEPPDAASPPAPQNTPLPATAEDVSVEVKAMMPPETFEGGYRPKQYEPVPFCPKISVGRFGTSLKCQQASAMGLPPESKPEAACEKLEGTKCYKYCDQYIPACKTGYNFFGMVYYKHEGPAAPFMGNQAMTDEIRMNLELERTTPSAIKLSEACYTGKVRLELWCKTVEK